MSMTTGGGPKLKSTLSAFQLPVSQELGGQITHGLRTGATELGVPLFSAEEQAAIADITSSYETMQEQFGELGIMEVFEKAMRGKPTSEISPEVTEAFFKKSIAAPLKRTLLEDVIPSVSRAYRGFTSRRSKAIERVYSNFSDTLAAELTKLQYQGEVRRQELEETAAQRAINAATIAPGVLATPFRTALSYASAMGGVQARERGEAMRMTPEANPWLNVAMGFLGTPQTQFVDKPETLTGFGTALAGISGMGSTMEAWGKGVSAMVGAGASSGGTFAQASKLLSGGTAI